MRMKCRNMFSLLCATGMLLGMAAGAFAQKPATPPTTAKKPGVIQRMKTKMSSMTGKGNVVGNKNTKVYHLPGDKGQLPDPKNRVYFKTAKEAEAAGYHHAGAKMAPPTTKGPARDPKTGRFIKKPGK